MARYSVNQQPVSTLLGWVESGQVAIPELQRPFVWSSTKVRDLLDSLYKGYPVGYLITWQSVGAALKDGGVAAHQQILIDGQQRITALRAAISGLKVMDKRYRSHRITIAFDPVSEQFATSTPVIRKNPQWIPDVAELFNATSNYGFMRDYFARNPDLDSETVEASIGRLEGIRNAQIGIIALADELDVETVSEIFIRINSKGVPLSSGDFAMSKIATYGERGRNIRKLIDYFCHLAISPHVHEDIVANDPEFAGSPYMKAISWLRNDTDDLYSPEYGDLIRIANLVGFDRGKVAALVSELSGRDPETRKVDENRIPEAYDRLERSLLQIVKKYEFENFVMTIKSAGFIQPSMIGSMNAMNFSYALYLRLRKDSTMAEAERKRIVRRWFVMSMLTGRHSGSFESTWEQDIRRITAQGAAEYLKQLEDSELSNAFWNVQLPASLNTSSPRSPYFQAFLAAQVSSGARGFLSKAITVQAMQEQSGDIHHIMPKDYLRRNGYSDRGEYNQVANYVLTETAINIRIANRAPNVYMTEVQTQVDSGTLSLGGITTAEDLRSNFQENAIPDGLGGMEAADYPTFLEQRRKMMARHIKDYYDRL